MQKMSETTQIPCKKKTRAKLRRIGEKGQTYDDILNELIKTYKQKEEEIK